MEPRLKSSKKSTNLPTELCQQIEEIIRQTFGDSLKKATVVVEGHIYKQELLFRLGYRVAQQLKQPNFEISLEYDVNKDNMMQMVHIALDYSGSFLEQYLKGEFDEFELPREWNKIESEDRVIYARFSTTNTALETKANDLLGESEEDDSFVQGEDEEIVQKAVEDILGLDNDDDDGENGPTQH